MVRRKTEEIVKADVIASETIDIEEANETELTISDEHAEDIEEETEIEIETDGIKKIIHRLNKKPQKAPTGELKILHWTLVQPGQLSHTSQQLNDLPNDRKLLSPIHECRFYSLLVGEEKEYVEIIVDADFVYQRLSEILETYCTNKKEVQKLVERAETIAEELRIKKLHNELLALSQKYSISIDDLKAQLDRHK
jgi:hypothetical protein